MRASLAFSSFVGLLLLFFDYFLCFLWPVDPCLVAKGKKEFDFASSRVLPTDFPPRFSKLAAILIG
jgi:hypothetical protein